MAYERLSVLDITEPLYLTNTNALYVRPDVTSNMAGFIMAYSPPVWVAVMFSSLLVCGAMAGVLLGTKQLHEDQSSRDAVTGKTGYLQQPNTGLKERDDTTRFERLRGCLWAVERSALWTWCPLLAQSVPWQPSQGLAQGVGGLWLLMALTLCSVYSSNLMAMLTSPRVVLPFTSVEELAVSDLPTAVISGTVIYFQIEEADESSTLGGLRDQIQVYTKHEIPLVTRETLRGKHATLAPDIGLLGVLHATFSKVGECTLYMMPRGILGPSLLTYALPRGSPLSRRFDPIIARLRESGIMAKLLSDSLVNATTCASQISSSPRASGKRPLQIKDLYGVFMLYAGGTVLASASFVWERASRSA